MRIDGKPAQSITSWGHSQVVFTTPAGQGPAAVVNMTNVRGLGAANYLSFRYHSPTIVPPLNPTTAYTNGGTTLTISGQHPSRFRPAPQPQRLLT